MSKSKVVKTEKLDQVAASRQDLRDAAYEIREAVNVLSTSSPENPAPNPFVQNGGKGTTNPAASNDGANVSDSKDSESE